MGSWIDAVIFEFTRVRFQQWLLYPNRRLRARVARGACDVVPTQKVTGSCPEGSPRHRRPKGNPARSCSIARPGSSETERGGSLVVLLLAERAR